MQDERELAETAISGDLFGAAGLVDDGFPPAPPRYVLDRQLGRGGGGAVFLARDSILERPVALKYLSQDRPAELERFLREARLAARLNNPSIVQIYEAGEIDGLPYIAMQYVAGGNLASVNLPVLTTVKVMRQVAGALAHAHAEGIVHRDIKPENILLDLDGHAYLTDFGIARDLWNELGGTLSHDGQILGTPALMSPEQARGEIHAVDARSDIYALGATLYSRTAGRPPFLAEHVVDVLHAVIHQEPPLPRRYNAEIPRELEGVIMRCLAKRREERYQTMTEVIEELDRCLSGRERADISPRWFKSYVQQKMHRPQTDAVEVVDLERDWLPALEIAQEIAAWDTQLYRVRGDLVPHFPQLEAVIARLDRVLDQQPATAWARFYRGVARLRRGELRPALEDMERSLDRVRDLSGAYFELGRVHLALHFDERHAADEHLSRVGAREQLRLASSHLEEAAIAFEEARRLKPEPLTWHGRIADAVIQLAGGDVVAATMICDQVLADDPDLEEIWKLKGDALRRAGSDPLPAYERVVEIRRSHYQVWAAMADVHLAAGRFADARACATHALEAHSEFTAARVLLARTHLVEGQTTDSRAALEAGIELSTRLHHLYPDRYDAAVILAELQIELARVSHDRAWIPLALDTLDHAARLHGCRNRVTYLRTRAWLERARLTIAGGGDGAVDLAAVLAMREQAAAKLPDNEPWLALFAEAENLERCARRT